VHCCFCTSLLDAWVRITVSVTAIGALLLCFVPKSAALHAQVVAVRAFQGQATESNTQQQRLHLIKALELGKRLQCLCVCLLLLCYMACIISHCSDTSRHAFCHTSFVTRKRDLLAAFWLQMESLWASLKGLACFDLLSMDLSTLWASGKMRSFWLSSCNWWYHSFLVYFLSIICKSVNHYCSFNCY